MAEIKLKNVAKIISTNDTNEIKIVSSKIGEWIHRNSKITRACLVLRVESFFGSGIEVDAKTDNGSYEVIDYVFPSNGDAVCIDITEEINGIIKNTEQSVTVRFNGEIQFDSEISLDVSYIPERVMYDGNTYCEFDVSRAGSGKVNISSGAVSFVHSDSNVSGICHVYNTWQANKTKVDFDYPDVSQEIKDAIANYSDYGCGKGWKLNVHQYLIKRQGTSSQDVYTYVDGNGNYHEFTEKYYYMNGETKVFLDKSDVCIDFDGKLSYEGLEVKPELISTGGYILRTDYTGFAGAEKLELRSDDRANLEEEIENLKRTVEDCEYALVEYKKTESEKYKALTVLQELIEDKSGDLDRDNLYLQDNIADKTNNVFAHKRELDVIMRKDNDGAYESELGRAVDSAQTLYDGALTVLQNISGEIADTQASVAPNNADSGASKDQLERQSKANKDLNDAQSKLDSAQRALSKQLELLQQFIREKSNDIEEFNLDKNQELNIKRVSLLDLQDEFRQAKREYNKNEELRHTARNNELYDRAVADLDKASRLLEQREYELNKLKAVEPVRFLSRGDGIIMGFNESGVLMAVVDAYQNTTYINYEDGRIVSITDTDNNETAFEYENGLLKKIIDADEKVIKYDYFSNGMLSSVMYPDGTNTDFVYDENGLLIDVINSAGYGIKLSYMDSKVIKIEETTRTYEITDEGWRGFNSEEEEIEYGPKLLTAIAYNTHLCSSVTDRVGHKLTYVFDVYGKPATVYEGDYDDYGRNTKSISLDYQGGNQSFKIEDKIMNDNILKRMPEVNLSGELPGNPQGYSSHEYDIDVSLLPEDATNYVFSAWVKADSAFIPTVRKTSYSHYDNSSLIEETDTYKINRQFALRAELEYVTERNTVEKEEFFASFDWLNTDWQYLALPIGIREADKIGDRIVGKFPFKLGGGDRKLTKMKVIIDYSYNVNGKYDGTDGKHTGLLFDCVTLREGDWTYSKLASDGKAEYTEDSSSGSITFFEYDKYGHVVKETTKDREYKTYNHIYEYNKQGALIRDTDHTGLCKETIYDENGRTFKAVTYNISDPTSKYYSENIVDDKGRVAAEVDITGKFNSVEYEFDNKGEASIVKDANGTKTAYGYHNDELVSISSDCDGEENKNTVKHTLGYTTKVSSGETNYIYTYDGWGRGKAIYIGGELYSETNYVDDYTTRVVLATGESITEHTDGKEDALTVISVDGEEYSCKKSAILYAPVGESDSEQKVEYYDEEYGILRQSIDKSTGIEYNTEYKYDGKGRLVQKRETGAGSLTQTIGYYDRGGVRNSEYNINGIRQTYGYDYDGISDRNLGMTLPDGSLQSVGYDGLGRVNSITLAEALPNGKSNAFTKDIYYAKYGDHATKYVSSVWYGNKGKRDDNIRYTYDKTGNITSVTENGIKTIRYTYDGLGRLIREDNKTLGKTETFEYDNNGNILAKTKYAYTLEPEPTDGDKKAYLYSVDGWRDRLVSFGNEAIGNYNGLGNPHIYRGKQLGWTKGRLLSQIGDESYTYNAEGMRLSKTVGDTRTIFYLDDGKIIAEERRKISDGSVIDTVCYSYGAEGITGFEIINPDGTRVPYIYRKNINGDITHIYTASGDLVVKYVYDAWGNHDVFAADGYKDLAARNAFRYRGYYYDVTTKLYYLKNRYYDPEIGRFISADAISELTPEEPNGLNLYRYCANNPVMMNDSEGNAPKWWEWLVSGVLLTVGIVLCATGVGTGLGAGLIVAGSSMLASNIMSTAGVNGKTASIISAGLNIMAGIVLCCTGVGGAMGASLIGAGVGSIAGGYISEAVGYGFEAGAMIGGIVGGIVGGAIYNGVTAAASQKTVQVTKEVAEDVANNVSKEASIKLDPRSIAEAKKGNPTFGTFRKRVWMNEAKYNRGAYSKGQLDKMVVGKAPLGTDGKTMQLHHVVGRKNDLYNVVKLTQSQHIAFHKAFTYHDPTKWNLTNLLSVL